MKNYLWIPLALLLPIALTNCNQVKESANHVAASGDYTLAKNTFEGLTRGDTGVAKDVDWEMLKTPEGDVGAGYAQIPTETEKQQFQKTFILNFAAAFQKAPVTYTNWKTTFHDEHKTEVSADGPNGKLVLIVTTREGKDRLSAISFLQ